MVRLHCIFAIIATLISLLLTSCDATIHFYPEAEEPNLPIEEQYDLIINEFYTGNDYSHLDTYTTIEHSRSKNEEMPQTRHIVQIFDMDNNLIDTYESISEKGTFNDDKEQTFSLPPGDYRVLCWTDYISQDNTDWHYDTSKFPEVELRYEKTAAGFMIHNGNTEYRDAYFGTATFNVPIDNKVKIEMRRPMGRFIFEATDLETFAEKHQIEITQQGRNGVETLEGYRAILCYDGYMPSRFNLQANAPSDSRLGAAFNGVLVPATSGSGFIEVGSDLVFSHVDETTVNVIFQLYDEASGELVASTPSIPIPLIRDHVTIVRGKFLSMNVGTGVVIDPSFNGEYNYEYK